MNKYQEMLSRFNLHLNDWEISRKVNEMIESKTAENAYPEIYKTLYACIDLTSLNTEDSKESIWQLVKQVNDFEGASDVDNVAAICIYPNFVETVKEALTADVKIVAAAAGFPSSQTFMEIKMAEVGLAVADGADEIDVVMNIGAFFDDDFETLCLEIDELKEACRDARLKVILETGLLKTASNIKQASLLAMYSGADFIKTSTGKGYSGATPEAVCVMCEAIREYYQLHDKKIGIKVAGGIRTAADALKYYTIVKEMLGLEWLNPGYFRIGASGLTADLLDIIR